MARGAPRQRSAGTVPRVHACLSACTTVPVHPSSIDCSNGRAVVVVVPLPLLAVVVPLPLPLPEAWSAQTGGASVTGGPVVVVVVDEGSQKWKVSQQ